MLKILQKSSKVTVIIALSLIVYLPFNTHAQKFWLLTNEFHGGPKKGITLSHDTCLYVATDSGVMRSCDGGEKLNRSLRSSNIFSVFAGSSGKIYAGGMGKIFITDQQTQNWDSIAINSVFPVVQIIENKNGELFAGTKMLQDDSGDGVFYSNDSGKTWNKRTNGLGNYKGCEQLAIDKNGRLYLSVGDDPASGNGGLFISDNNGLLWEHIQIQVDGKSVIPDHMDVGHCTGLSISPDDSVYFSFIGTAVNAAMRLNLRKHITDIRNNNNWDIYKISNSNTWWLDRTLNSIYFAKNGDFYSSLTGGSFGGTYFRKNNSKTWNRIDFGLGVDKAGIRNVEYFTETPDGIIYMVQKDDERIYRTDTSRFVSINPNHTFSDFSVYPSPVKTGEFISIHNSTAKQDYKVSIYDINGKMVYSAVHSEQHIQIEAPKHPGIFIICIEDQQTNMTSRLMVME